MEVSELMTKDPACCTPDTNLGSRENVVDHDCGCMPVVDSRKRA